MDKEHSHCRECGKEIGSGRIWWIRFQKEVRPAAWCRKATVDEYKMGPLCHSCANAVYKKVAGENALPLPDLHYRI